MFAAAAAAASVIRRCAAHYTSSRGFGSCTVNGGGGSSRRAAGQPWLLLSSPDDPESRYLCKLTKDEKSGRNNIELERKLDLPQIAGDEFVGSSQGLLLTRPTIQHGTKIRAIDPLTGEEELRLPPCDAIVRQERVPDTRFDDLFKKSKAILSPSRHIAAILLPVGGLRVSIARLDGTSPWTPIPFCSVEDFIFHKGRLHIVDCKCDLVVCDDDDKDLSSISAVCSTYIDLYVYEERDWPVRMYLAESPNGDDLFLLIRSWSHFAFHRRTASFQVFKLNGYADDGCFGGRRHDWEEVDNLGDAAFFVGPNHAVSLCAGDFPALQPNAIYFTDNVQYSYGEKSYKWADTGVFCLEDESSDFFDVTNGDMSLHYPLPIWLENAAPCRT